MAKKKSPNDLYWDAKKKEQVRAQYNRYLKDEKLENNSKWVSSLFNLNAFNILKLCEKLASKSFWLFLLKNIANTEGYVDIG